MPLSRSFLPYFNQELGFLPAAHKFVTQPFKMSEISLQEMTVSADVTEHVKHVAPISRFDKSEFDSIPIYRPVVAKWRLVVILSCLCVGLFISLMDNAIVSTALYTISGEFGNFRISSWIILAYTLADVGSAITIARLADVMGRKLVVICAFIVFATFSLACGWSKSMNQLITFRAFQGIGGAGLYSMTMVIFPEVSPPAMIPLVSSVLGAIVAIAGITGPILGGALTTYASWRWIFWINAPLAIIPMSIIMIVWPKDFHALKASSTSLRRLDFVGCLLMMSGSVLLVFMLFQGAARAYPWKSVAVIITFTIAGCSWVGLVAWEWNLSRYSQIGGTVPHFPFRLMKERIMMSGFVSTFLTGFVLLLAVVNIPLRAQIVDVVSAVKSGLQLLPLVGSCALGSALGGGASFRKNHAYLTLNLASALMLLGCGLLSTLPESGVRTKAHLGYEFIMGLGIGISLSTMTLMTSMQVLFIDHAVAQGIVAQLRIFGGSVGVAVSTIVLNNDIAKSLSNILSPTELSDFYSSPISIFNFTPVQQYYVRKTFITTFNKDMRMCMYVSIVCLLVTLCAYQKNPPTMKDRINELEAAYVRTEQMEIDGDA